MKPVYLLLLIFLPVIASAQEAKPAITHVEVNKSEPLVADDLGIGKYVFESVVPAGKVMVLRSTEEQRGFKHKTETISHANGEKAREVVLVFDSSKFPFFEGDRQRVVVQSSASSAYYSDHRVSVTATMNGKLTLVFVGKDEDKDVVIRKYECVIEDYEVAKKRHPRLPAPDGSWGYNGPIK